MRKLINIFLHIFVICLTCSIAVSQVREDAFVSTSDTLYQELQISINAEGSVFLEGASVSNRQLKNFINDLHNAEDYAIVVVADDEADSEQVLKEMNICCNYKIAKVKLVYSPSWNAKG